jgi:PKD repeat protein
MLFGFTIATTKKPTVMKRLLTILPLLSLIVISCHKDPPPPYAEAGVDLNPAYVGEYVRFTSYSTNTDYVEWDMDDGYTYNTGVVDHFFEDPGLYDVTLKAFGANGRISTAVVPMEVIGSEITIEVREYWDEYLIPNVEIHLFETYDDWFDLNWDNAIGPFYTNSYGEVTIDGLSYQKYYVDAYYRVGNEGYTNEDLGLEDVYWVETSLLTGWETHFFTAYVDAVIWEDLKKSAEKRKERNPLSPAAGQLKTAGDKVKKENKSSEERERK